MVRPAKAISHKRYDRVKFNWSEAYAPFNAATDDGNIYGWILNRPGPNLGSNAPGRIHPTTAQGNDPQELVERLLYNTAGNFGESHQPYLFDQVKNNYDEYRIYGCKYKLTVKNTSTTNTVNTDDVYVAVGVTQEMHTELADPDKKEFLANHRTNQPRYIEGRHPEWRRKRLKPQQTHSFEGYVSVKHLLKKSAYLNDNDHLSSYPWYRIPANSYLQEFGVIGDENQEQPYSGHTAKIANIKETHGAADWVDATYGRAPQCAFLYMSVVQPDAGLDDIIEVSLSVVQYIEFKRRDPQWDQS